MLTRRVISCLDVREGRVVKGVRFEGLREVGDPIELASRHAASGTDELCFLDVSASVEGTALMLELIRRVSREVFVPLTVGGGIRTVEDARALLRAGADKVALNTAALRQPELLGELAGEFGSQCVVLSIDTRSRGAGWVVTTHSATRELDRECVDWARRGVDLGAGEILLNVIDADGSRTGFSLEITGQVADAVRVPVIASGGAGEPEHFVELFRETNAAAALAASIFHDGSWTPQRLKAHLRRNEIEVRP
jgi:cyclase